MSHIEKDDDMSVLMKLISAVLIEVVFNIIVRIPYS